MAFATYGVDKREGNTGGVDFDAINKYVVETAGLEERETLPGVISAIIDLGIQEQPEAEVKFDGTAEDEAKIIAEQPDTHFKNGIDQKTQQPVRLKCWPQKPIQCVAIAVDFPSIVLDKGQFFGESSPRPLRLYMGGQFYIPSTGMVVGRPTPLRIVNLDKTRSTKKWSLAQNSILHKMAVGAKLIKPDEVFLPQDIDKLLGQALQFDAQVHFKTSNGKEYYTEYIKYVGGLARGQSVPELDEPVYLIQFNDENEVDAIRELRNHVVNTIKKAENYEGSKIKAQIEAVRNSGAAGDTEPQEDATPPAETRGAVKPKAKPAAKKASDKKPAQAPADIDSFDDDIPW